MKTTSNLLELPVGSTFKCYDDPDTWTVETRSEVERVFHKIPNDVIPCSYPNEFLSSGKAFDWARPNDVEKVLSIPAFRKEAQPKGNFVQTQLPDDFNRAIVTLAQRFDRRVVFSYQKPGWDSDVHVVKVSDVVGKDIFGGTDEERNNDYRQFRFDRVDGEVELA